MFGEIQKSLEDEAVNDLYPGLLYSKVFSLLSTSQPLPRKTVRGTHLLLDALLWQRRSLAFTEHQLFGRLPGF